MKEYPQKVRFSGTLYGVENPVFVLEEIGGSWQYQFNAGDEFSIIEPEIALTHPLFTPVEPDPPTHEIKLVIDGQEDQPFINIQEPARIIIETGAGNRVVKEIGEWKNDR